MDSFAKGEKPFEYGKAEILTQDENAKILLLGYGNGVGRAVQTAENLKLEGVQSCVVDLRFAKPLDEECLVELAKKYTKWFVFSDSAKYGGVASLLGLLKEKKALHVAIESFEYEDHFIHHGNTKLVEEELGILPEQIAKKIVEKLV
jgi:1-deoxy-D-xylulose-5-phosphate synthase